MQNYVVITNGETWQAYDFGPNGPLPIGDRQATRADALQKLSDALEPNTELTITATEPRRFDNV